MYNSTVEMPIQIVTCMTIIQRHKPSLLNVIVTLNKQKCKTVLIVVGITSQ